MKLEIEIADEEIRGAMGRKVREALNAQTVSYATERYIKDRIADGWQSAVDAMVAEALSDSAAIREKIAAEIERKLRSQLAVAMKKVDK